MSACSSAVEEARAAAAHHRWTDARAGFLAVRAERPLSLDDLRTLSDASWWVGEIDESIAVAEEAYDLAVRGEPADVRAAAMIALEIGYCWFLRGEEAIGSGWMSRAHRLLDGLPETVEHGYLRTAELEQALAEADYDRAISVAQDLSELATRSGDETLLAYALVDHGIALIKRGDVDAGMAIVDEAMLPVVAGRVRPTFAGNIYCQLMSICHELGDVRRAGQWTDATERWCAGFDNAVMFIGVCRVHRAQLLHTRGEWARAEREIELVCEELAAMNAVAVALALYELGEVRRKRGDLTGAEDAFNRSRLLGRPPLPGLALVWSARGEHQRALDALLAAEDVAADRLGTVPIWDALVDVALAAGELGSATRASNALEAVAATYNSSGLRACSATAIGRVECAAGDVAAAIASLERARRCWQEIDDPYRVAITTTQLAAAHAALGRHELAAMEGATAAELLARLGVAAPAAPAPARPAAIPGGLTPRELDVLRLVSRGMTNRDVAQELVVSERTVARHLANIYMKLGVSSRTAAARWAHEQHIVEVPPTPRP